MRKSIALMAATSLLAVAPAATAAADTVGPFNFDDFALGTVNGQQSWQMLGGFDVSVVKVNAYPAAKGYGFGSQALRLSDAVTTQAFGDQTFAPSLPNAAGEGGEPNFEASFSIGSATGAAQPGMHMSVSPDSGDGGRMSYLRFEDKADGIHVNFDGADFVDHDIATLSYKKAHTVRFAITFVPGAGNDVVKIYVDGALKWTGPTWEDYYRFDPEQAGNDNQVPPTRSLIFRESGTADPANVGNGYLVEKVQLGAGTAPANADACKKDGWKTYTIRSFKNQGDCVSYTQSGK